METRPLTTGIRRPGAARAWYAAIVLCALLAALLGAWFVSGWHDVRMRQTEAREAPRKAAAQRADEIARELHGELEILIGREVRRPYFHYQNLMHDPRASVRFSVSPSPLATNPEDKLVLGYFQIDTKGRATTPTINDDFPDLSEPDNIAGNSAFRRQVILDLVDDLTPQAPPVMVAEVTLGTKKDPVPRPRPPAVQNAAPQTQNQVQTQQTQVIQVDPESYVQNSKRRRRNRRRPCRSRCNGRCSDRSHRSRHRR